MIVFWLASWSVFVFSLGETADTNPQPLGLGDPVVYPVDYCQNIKSNEEFDVIVVGAGPAGSALARRLSEIPSLRILLIEAGGDPPSNSDIPGNALMLGLNVRWNFTTVETPQSCRGVIFNRCNYVPGRLLGGSSSVNYMMYTRGNKEDFEEWEALGNPGWGYQDVLPFFKKLENFVAQPLSATQTNETASTEFHRTGGPLTTAYFPLDPKTHGAREAIIEAAAANGIQYNSDINGASQIGFTNLPGMVNQLGYRQNTAKAYLLKLPDNLKVCKNAIVTKVTITNKKATGVEFIYPTNGFLAPFLPRPRTIKVRASREVIISGGPLNSPPILERSGIGRRDILSRAGVKLVHELPGVGENLQDQYINLGAAFTIDYGTQQAMNPLSNELTSLTGFFNFSDPTNSIPDVQYILKTYDVLIGLGLAYKPGIQLQFDSTGTDIMFFGPILLRQTTPGSVHIIQSLDPRITPRIAPNQYSSQAEIDLNIAATRRAREIMADPIMAKYKPKPFILSECKNFPVNSDLEITCMTRIMANSLYHLAGSCKMGPSSDPNAVVDARLRVHGIKNLRVIDSSIMPLVTRANTEIPSVMIGERGAELVKEDLMASRKH